MALVTVSSPPTMAGAGKTVLQLAGRARFVVDCKVNALKSVDHVKITLDPDRLMASNGKLLPQVEQGAVGMPS